MMTNINYLKTGKTLFAIAILAIGLIHLIFQNFPMGLLPIPAAVPGRLALANLTGIGLVAAGIALLFDKLTYYGAIVSGIIWLLLIVLFQLPTLMGKLNSPNTWTGAFECIMLLGGVCLVLGDCFPFNKNPAFKPAPIGRYLYLSGLAVFAILHYVYLQFIAMLVPLWLPGHVFWAWLVLIAFILSALSIVVNKKVKPAMLLLSFMFLTWVAILHLPRAFAKTHSEPEWTSTCIALAAGGVALMMAGKATAKD